MIGRVIKWNNCLKHRQGIDNGMRQRSSIPAVRIRLGNACLLFVKSNPIKPLVAQGTEAICELAEQSAWHDVSCSRLLIDLALSRHSSFFNNYHANSTP